MAQELIREELPPLASVSREEVKQVQPAPASQPPPPQAKPALASQRLQSLDVYRGLIMVTLAFNGFGLAATALNHQWHAAAAPANLPVSTAKAVGLLSAPLGQGAILAASSLTPRKTSSPFWEEVHHQFEHVQWAGCGYWDLIQPSFMFMVGVAMAFSYLRRAQSGQSYRRMLGHAMFRSLVLILLAIFLSSNFSRSTEWGLMNVLAQIGLGYTFLFLLWGRSFRTQALTAAAILVGTWLLYVHYPHAGIDLAKGAPEVGVSKEWAQQNLSNIPAAWHKNANVGHAIDEWLLNEWPPRVWPVTLLPEPKPFRFNNGGYQTINFLPSLATMLFGLMCGELLRSARPSWRKLMLLVEAGLIGLAAGLLLDRFEICPIIKRIWTPSWALFSTGWCCLILAALYLVVDLVRFRVWAFPLLVVGMNSIGIYCMSQLLKPWAKETWMIHLGRDVFLAGDLVGPGLGRLFEPMVQAVLVGLLFWLACLWMYRQKIFIRI